MSVFVTGQSGWVGGYVIKVLQKRGIEVADDLNQQPEAIIHLAWRGIPNYSNPIHLGNIEWQLAFLKQVAAKGITNITIAGTCLETLDKFIPYSIAKLAVKALAQDLFNKLKWARLWYLYGEGQRASCLFPKLMKAKAGEEFSVIDAERDFMEITVAAEHICNIALQTKVTGTIDCCTGVAVPVEDFCRRHAPNLIYKKNYALPPYEPFSFCGNPSKLDSIEKAKSEGIWWCNSHGREATHTYQPPHYLAGEHCCDPKLGGILLPCRAILAPIEIIEHTR